MPEHYPRCRAQARRYGALPYTRRGVKPLKGGEIPAMPERYPRCQAQARRYGALPYTRRGVKPLKGGEIPAMPTPNFPNRKVSLEPQAAGEWTSCEMVR